jgi:hypothetical protein
MSEAGTIKAQDTIASGKELYETADREVLNHRSVAVEKDHARGSRVSPLLIVHTDPIALDEPTHRWIFSFCYDREHEVPDDQENQDNGNDGENGCDCRHGQYGLNQHQEEAFAACRNLVYRSLPFGSPRWAPREARVPSCAFRTALLCRAKRALSYSILCRAMSGQVEFDAPIP